MILFDMMYDSAWTETHTAVQIGVYVLNGILRFDQIPCHHPKPVKFSNVQLNLCNLSAIFQTTNDQDTFGTTNMMLYWSFVFGTRIFISS